MCPTDPALVIGPGYKLVASSRRWPSGLFKKGLKFSAKINIGEVKGVPVPKTHVRYSDNHGVFRVNHEGALGGDGMTQFGRALDALNIEIICANSSQAKGRVERAHKTPACPGWPRETNRAMAQHTAEENAVSSAPSCDPHQHG